MKPIKPIYIQRSNKNEKIAGLVFLLVIALVLLFAGMVSGKHVIKAGTINKPFGSANIVESNGGALINWSSPSEEGVPFFLIERSQDKVHYEIVSIVKNTGNGNSTDFYTATDYNPLEGTAYYRISETNFKDKTVHLFQLTYSAKSITAAKN